MLHPIRAAGLAATAALALLAARDLPAQAQTRSTTATDARWYAWLGCWAPDNASAASTSSETCVVPVAGARDVDLLSIARGKVISRDRLDTSGKPHDVNGQGCAGSETVNWSASGRQAFLHAGYTCGGITAGSSATLLALTPDGGWLRVERVRSGNGQIVNLQRFHEIEPGEALSAEDARAIERQRRAIATARAAAASPITTDEIVDAARHVDADVVTSWIASTGQTFDANAQQITTLLNAGVPESAVRAMLASGARAGDGNAASGSYPASAPAQAPQMQTMYVCPPDGCYPQRRYSDYNGDGCCAPTYPYAYPVYPYGYFYAYPLGYAPYSVIRPGIVHQVGPLGIHRGQSPIRPAGVRPGTIPTSRPRVGPTSGRPGGSPGGRRP